MSVDRLLWLHYYYKPRYQGHTQPVVVVVVDSSTYGGSVVVWCGIVPADDVTGDVVVAMTTMSIETSLILSSNAQQHEPRMNGNKSHTQSF